MGILFTENIFFFYSKTIKVSLLIIQNFIITYKTILYNTQTWSGFFFNYDTNILK